MVGALILELALAGATLRTVGTGTHRSLGSGVLIFNGNGTGHNWYDVGNPPQGAGCPYSPPPSLSTDGRGTGDGDGFGWGSAPGRCADLYNGPQAADTAGWTP